MAPRAPLCWLLVVALFGSPVAAASDDEEVVQGDHVRPDDDDEDIDISDLDVEDVKSSDGTPSMKDMGLPDDAELIKVPAWPDDESMDDPTNMCGPHQQDKCSEEQLQAAQVAQQVLNVGNECLQNATDKDTLEKCLQAFQVALAVDNRTGYSTSTYVNIGIILRKLGRFFEGLPFLKRAVVLDPALFHAQYNLGNALIPEGDWVAADWAFRKSLDLAQPAHKFIVSNAWADLLRRAHFFGAEKSDRSADHFEGRDLLQEAHDLLEPAMKHLPDGDPFTRPKFIMLSSILYRQGKHGQRKKLHKLAVEKKLWKHPDQRPGDFNWDFANQFKSTPYWKDLDSLPFLKEVAKYWEEMKREAEAMMFQAGIWRYSRLGLGVQYIRDHQIYYDGEDERLLLDAPLPGLDLKRPGEWKQLPIVMFGQENSQAAWYAPTAAKAFRKNPLFGEGTMGEVVLSVLTPGARLEPHCGEANNRLTCHLGLSIPATDVGISVAGKRRKYKEGKWICFDDSYENREWNNDVNYARTVLVIRFKHPKL